jgi:hypothetical protein
MRSPNSAIVRAITHDPRVVARFWSHVDRGGSAEDCWEWRGPHLDTYPVFRVKYSAMSAARLAWFAATGELPLGGRLRHRCENTRCVRPEHMDWELGTRTGCLLRAAAEDYVRVAAGRTGACGPKADVPYRRAS